MKHKNVEVGQFIVAKKTYGDAFLGYVFTVGVAYQVTRVEPLEYTADNLTVELVIPETGNRWWVNPKHFRKCK